MPGARKTLPPRVWDRTNARFELACQIGVAARFDREDLAVDVVRYFYDDDDVGDPVPVEGGLMLVFATIGFLVNVIAVWILHGVNRASLNVRGAYLHVLGDLLASGGTIIAAVLVRSTGWRFVVRHRSTGDRAPSLLLGAMFCSQYLRNSSRVFCTTTIRSATNASDVSPSKLSPRATAFSK